MVHRRSPRHSPRQSPHHGPVGNGLAVNTTRRRTNGHGDDHADDRQQRHSAGAGSGLGGRTSEPVRDVLNRIAAMREASGAAKMSEEEDHRRDSLNRLDALRGLAAAHQRSSPKSSQRLSGAGKVHRTEDPGDRRRRSSTSTSAVAGTTLRKALGLPSEAPALSDRCALIVIDAQITYTEGPMQLHNVVPALTECAKLLDRARRAGALVVHVAHHAGEGTLYDVTGRSGSICEDVAPLDTELVIVKKFPNSFEQTDLDQYLRDRGIVNLVICGFMTHCCVSSTARAAFNLQRYQNVTVVASATASRCLADPQYGDAVDPDFMQAATLAGISELHANVVPTVEDVPRH